MSKAAHGIVKRRKGILIAALILCILCGGLSVLVPINSDMTKYLPADSNMKQGIDLLSSEFSNLPVTNTIRVMFSELPEEKEEEISDRLKALPYVSSVVLTDRKQDEGAVRTLYTVSTDYDYRSKEELELEHGIPGAFPDYQVTVCSDDTMGMEIPVYIFVIAGIILIFVLLILSASLVEPFLFLLVIGGAILLNMGTNLILGSVSQTTWSISAVLQLVLSMDYSIILMNRYRQEKEAGSLPEEAMERALKRASSSIASSSFTTFVGLLMLVFMRFRIGKDIGLVLAKGVFLSMLCCIIVLPGLILLADPLIEKTRKRALHIPTKALASFGYRCRYVLAVGFVFLFFGSWYLESLAGISYSLDKKDPIAEIFPPENPVVVLYANSSEEQAALLAKEIEKDPGVISVMAYSTTIGARMTPEELADYLKEMMSDGGGMAGYMPEELSAGLDPAALEKAGQMLSADNMKKLYAFYGMANGGETPETLSLEEIFAFLKENADSSLFGAMIGEEMRGMILNMGDVMDYARSQLIGQQHSLMMISTNLPLESGETTAFVQTLRTKMQDELREDYYLIGNSVMGDEMKESFGGELLLISLLTAGSIFLVVLVTFRQLLIPAVLVLLVQCGVFLTVTTTWVIGYKMYYLAILIVQCILMGATVDYGILFTNYYRESRLRAGLREALRLTYQNSMHTILTSSLFMIIATGVVGLSPADPTITQICRSISIGAAAAVLLVIFVLPGILAAADRFTAGPERKRD